MGICKWDPVFIKITRVLVKHVLQTKPMLVAPGAKAPTNILYAPIDQHDTSSKHHHKDTAHINAGRVDSV